MRRTNKQKLLLYTRPHFYERVMDELDSMESKVCWLLGKHEHLRNCDTCLIWKVWEDFDKIKAFPKTEEKHALTAAETIRRIRQKLQENGLWPPTDPETILLRKIKQEAMEKWIIHKKKIGGINENEYVHK